MSCADVCIDMGYDCGNNEFYAESLPISRKDRVCCECAGAIKAGQRYQRATGKSDGSVWTAITCRRCAEIREAWVCGSWVFGALWEHVESEVFPEWGASSPIDCLAKIESREARDLARQRYDDWRADR